jgi:hypothetical protein
MAGGGRALGGCRSGSSGGTGTAILRKDLYLEEGLDGLIDGGPANCRRAASAAERPAADAGSVQEGVSRLEHR